MPTPVSVARQCLAETAVAVLNDAVAVAKRRSHAQTTSLHVVSALLALPSSSLREACTRSRSSACPPRIQFRALELCVGVALDRVSVSKSAADEPPVSNSLMAAIKRSQANQRRHPETFHMYQQQLSSNYQNPPSVSAVKVELKHFIMSILDDPIVSRVFGDSGFQTQEIKLAFLNPLTMSRFSTTISRPPPPPFRCSLRDFELNKDIHKFPFSEVGSEEKLHENSRRILKILLKTTRRNPLLIGVYGNDAYMNFIDCLKKGVSEFLPKEIDGLSVVSLENEISECIGEALSEEMIELKFKQVDKIVKDCQGPGIIVKCGDFKAFVGVESVDVVNCVVSKLKRLLIDHSGKLWLIGFLAGDDDYTELLQRFPSIDMDLDLHLLPITTSSMGGKSFKSSLMRSFVPFGGFFSMPSDLESPCTNATKPLRLCNLCNEKYEQEVSEVQKAVSTNSVADKQLVNLSSWLQTAEYETSKISRTVEAKEANPILDARVMASRRKWSDICQRLHGSWTSHEDITPVKPQNSSESSLQNVPIGEDSVDVGPLCIGSRVANFNPCISSDLQKSSLPRQDIPGYVALGASVNAQAEVPVQVLRLNNLQKSSVSQQKMSWPIACASSPSFLSVTTELTLGTLSESAEECRRNLNLQYHYNNRQISESSKSQEKSLSQVSQSSSSWHHLEKQINTKDLDHQWKVLAEKIYWQMEAIQTISRAITCCRNESERYHRSNKGNVWLSFLGPDKMGKRKIATSVAEIVFGRKEHFLFLDLNSQDVKPFNSVVDCYDTKYQKVNSRRKMFVDYLAEELSKHPHSVVLLENPEKADFLVRSSLCQAVKTGKFPDSHGRDINLNNNVFILASSVLRPGKDLLFGEVASEFPEETILEAKNLQMQILVGSVDGNYSRNSTAYISVSPSKIIFNRCPPSKRKSVYNNLIKAETSKRACQLSRSIDLNVSVEDMEEGSDTDKSDNDGDDADNSDNSEVWLEELLEHVDEIVVFKPFDFDSLARTILKEINVRLKELIGATLLLEIDQQVMVQILAAAWLTDRENALEDWIDQVLCLSIEEARQRCNVASGLVLKLAPCDGLVVETQASGVCLPAIVNVN